MPMRLIQQFFKGGSAKGIAPHNTPAPAAPVASWPWRNDNITEAYIRSLMQTRVRFLRGVGTPESPDLPGILADLAKTQPQHQTLARLWREEFLAYQQNHLRA